ncbi:hypothetical protein ACFZDJ_42890 [Streptomyces sp. NPDC007896]|uniref:hypothetical protein n=1 Tax=unclassified Streptomyces TaxID=2593676 RepID=UPI0036E03786
MGDPAALFTPDAGLPSLDLAGLRLMTGGRDSVAPSLAAALDDDLPEPVRPPVESHARGLAAVADACARLGPQDLSIAAPVEVRDLASRYATALAAAACVGVARHAPEGGFLARPEWLVSALTRLGGMGAGRSDEVPAETEGPLVEELLDRADRSVSFGLSARPYR